MLNENLRLMVEAIVYRVEGKRPIFLLLKRTAIDGDFWQPVTGGVEDNETDLDALKREIKEETSIREVISISKAIYQFSWQRDGITRQETAYGVLVDQAPITLSQEHTEYRWCYYDDAIKLLQHQSNQEALQRLASLLKNEYDLDL